MAGEDTTIQSSSQQAVIAINRVAQDLVDVNTTLETSSTSLGDINTTLGTINATLAANANMADSTIKGRAVGAGTGAPQDLSATQATAILNNVVGDSGGGGTKGLVPAPAAGDTAANKYLKADGAWTTPQIFRETAATTTSGTEHDFTGIPTWVRRITVMLSGVSLSGTDSLLVQLGNAGGFETSGYYSVGILTINAAATVSDSSTSGIILPVASAAAAVSATFTLVNITGNVWIADGKQVYDAATDGCVALFANKTLSAQLDRIRLTRDGTDTFDAGTFNIYYE